MSFGCPALARWDFIQANAKVAVGTTLSVKNGKPPTKVESTASVVSWMMRWKPSRKTTRS